VDSGDTELAGEARRLAAPDGRWTPPGARAWDSASVGGEEVDIDWLLEGPQAGKPAAPHQLAASPAG
jgi:hypothetical protein